MDSEILVDSQQYNEGKKLIKNLDENGFKYPIALWINFPERNDWILLFGVPKLNKTGSKVVFNQIYDVIKDKKIDISLKSISLIDTNSDLCNALKRMIKTGYGIGNIRFTGNVINGRPFPDSVIYRVN